MISRLLSVILSMALIVPVISAAEPSDSLACSRSIERSVVSAIGGLVINAAATEALKAAVKEKRPDASDSHSFPSRHTSYAFALATVASHELSLISPFFVTGAQTVANAVAMQRVMAHRHYPGDVFAGAALGFLSSELGYYIGNLIFHHKGCSGQLPVLENVTALTSATTLLIPFSSYSDGVTAGTGFESSLGINLPVSEKFGLLSDFVVRSQSIYSNGEFVGTLDGCGLRVGGYFFRSWGLWALDIRAAGGAVYSFKRPMNCSSEWSGLFDVSAGMARRVGRHLSVGANAGVDFADRPANCIALSLSLGVKAEF